MAEKLTLLDMLKHAMASWSSFSIFIVVLIGSVGVWIAFIAITNYKNHTDGKCGIAKPIFQTILAALMVAVARFIPILTETLNGKAAAFKPGSLLSDIPQTDPLGVGLAFTSILLFVQFLGVVALFRGFLMVYAATNRANEGFVGKAWTHIIGGVLAVNIQLTIGTLASTFYPGIDLSFLGL